MRSRPSRRDVRGIEAEELPRAACVDAAAWLSARLRLVPDDPTVVACDGSDELGELADRDLLARSEVHGLGAVVALRGEDEALDAVLDVEELPRRRAVAPEDDLVLGLEHLPDERGNHVRGLEVEVVPRPVQVRRQEEDCVQPVLLSVGLRADEDRLLRNAVRRVRLLRIAVPEIGPRENGMGANFGYAQTVPTMTSFERLVEACLLEHMRAHHEVRVPVAARVGAVRADAADLGREVEDELRRGVLEHPLRVLHGRQVVVGASSREHVVSVALEALDEVGPEEAAPACDQHTHGRQGTAAPGFRTRPYDAPGEVAPRPSPALRRPRCDPRRRRVPALDRRRPIRPVITATKPRFLSTRTRSRPGCATRTGPAFRCSSARSTTTRVRCTRTFSPASSASPVPTRRSLGASRRSSFSRRFCSSGGSRGG